MECLKEQKKEKKGIKIMVDKIKKILTILIAIYIIFSLTQVVPKFNIVNLKYKENAKILTAYNEWSKFEENQIQIKQILKNDEEEVKKESSNSPSFVSVNEEDKELRTTDGKYTYSQVKKYDTDVKGFNKLNSFIMDLHLTNIFILIIIFLYRKYFRRGY